MTDSLDSNSRLNLVKYRIRRSEETFLEADCLASNGHYSGALNRLYYACYYMVTSLLIANEIQATTHAGVISMFAKNFIKTGLVSISNGKFFNEIFEIRHSNDYDDFIYADEDTYISFRPKANALIKSIISLLPDCE